MPSTTNTDALIVVGDLEQLDRRGRRVARCVRTMPTATVSVPCGPRVLRGNEAAAADLDRRALLDTDAPLQVDFRSTATRPEGRCIPPRTSAWPRAAALLGVVSGACNARFRRPKVELLARQASAMMRCMVIAYCSVGRASLMCGTGCMRKTLPITIPRRRSISNVGARWSGRACRCNLEFDMLRGHLRDERQPGAAHTRHATAEILYNFDVDGRMRARGGLRALLPASLYDPERSSPHSLYEKRPRLPSRGATTRRTKPQLVPVCVRHKGGSRAASWAWHSKTARRLAAARPLERRHATLCHRR